MNTKNVTLAIEKLAGLGDGQAIYDGRKWFVPYTAPGDRVTARVLKQTTDANYAMMESLIEAGPDRIGASCRHFGMCGGCSLQHVKPEAYRDFKFQTARHAVRKAGYDMESVQPLVHFPPDSRRRVELKIEAGKLGYYRERSHRLVDVEECPVLEKPLERLVLRLKPWLIRQPMLTGAQLNWLDDGCDLLLRGGMPDMQDFPAERICRVSLAQVFGITTLLQASPAVLTIGNIHVHVPPGAFLQASREAQSVMTQTVLDAVAGSRNVLDLFSGIGTYSFPMAEYTTVTAVEGDGAMVASMQATANEHGIALVAQQRDLFQKPLSMSELARFDAAVMNPPRTGAKEQSVELAKSGVAKLVMVSCNPATFVRDAKTLREAGYRLERVLPIDQFTWSPHLELVAIFAK